MRALLLFLAFLVGCGSEAAPDAAEGARPLSDAAPAGAAQTRPANVLLVIADDVGVDRVAAYREHPDPGRTPTIDALAAEGVLFRNAWANPLCSPTRATLFTGRYGFRTGIGAVVSPDFSGPGLDVAEWTLPRALGERAPVPYHTALIGKWHLAGAREGLDHARAAGFEHHAGSLGNLGEPGEVERYFDFVKVVDGEPRRVERYATSDTVDDALAAIGRYGDDPWLVVVSFNAPHKPYHRPPDELSDIPLSGTPLDSPIAHHKAMVQALDTELGRLLAGIPAERRARTHIIFVGDNGTQVDATEEPFVPKNGKGSLSEGGVNVPLIVTGPAVAQAGSECAALVNTTDLFATCLELCGGATTAPDGVVLDSVSLAPYLADPQRASERAYVYAERFSPNRSAVTRVQRRAIRGPRYKLVINRDRGMERLYDLEVDPFEQVNLLDAELNDEARAAHERLKSQLETLTGA